MKAAEHWITARPCLILLARELTYEAAQLTYWAAHLAY